MEAQMATDATDASLSAEIEAARGALIEVCRKKPTKWWPAYELKDEARNGWSDGAMTLALNRLIDEGKLDVQGDRVRLSS